jgi:endoglucanase
MEEIQSYGGTGMFRKKLTIMVLVSILLTGCLTGCGAQVAEAEQEREEAPLQTMEEDPDLSYEVPVSAPHILVNQLGYITQSTKIAVLCGSQLPDRFEVIDADTGKTVYTGKPEKRESQDSCTDEIGYGDFSQVELPGKYYIEAPLLGDSYSFQIADNLYDDVLKEAVKQYYYNRCGITLTEEFAGSRAHNACHTGHALLREDMSVSMDVSGGWHQDENGSKDVVRAAENISVMLLAYELFGDAFSDDMELPESRNGIPDLLDEIRYETLLKLFFGAEVGTAKTLEHIEHFREKTERELPYLLSSVQTLEKIQNTESAHRYYLLTALFGVKIYRAFLEWCAEAETLLNREEEDH